MISTELAATELRPISTEMKSIQLQPTHHTDDLLTKEMVMVDHSLFMTWQKTTQPIVFQRTKMQPSMKLFALAVGAVSSSMAESADVSRAATNICHANCTTDASGNEICKFTAVVDMFASELGYYTFEECGSTPNPTLGVELGKTYQFIQKDPSNHYHPLGFAYYPDGAHAGLDELEPSIVPPGSSADCSANLSCPSPMYHVNDNYLGTYPNFDAENSGMDHFAHFGLEEYESMFQHPITEWIEYGTFSAYLKIDNEADYVKDIFYFCHVSTVLTKCVLPYH